MLGWPLVWDQDEETAVQSPLGGTKLAWGGQPRPSRPPVSRQHLDLVTDDDLAGEVERLLLLGAARTGAGPDGAVVLADPDGTELRLRSRPAATGTPGSSPT